MFEKIYRFGMMCAENRLLRKENKYLNETVSSLKETITGELYFLKEELKDYQAHYDRAESENQRLKAEIEALKQSEQESLEIVTELREKNKRLTCKILEEAALNNTLCSNCEQCEDLRKIQAENERLRECINKIKEMLQNEHPFQDCSCGQDILDKISEAENDNN